MVNSAICGTDLSEMVGFAFVHGVFISVIGFFMMDMRIQRVPIVRMPLVLNFVKAWFRCF